MNPRMSVVHGQLSAGQASRNPIPKDNGQLTTDTFRNESLTDFSRDENRAAMQGALAEVRKQFGQKYPPLIDGKPNPTRTTVEVGALPTPIAIELKVIAAIGK